ncbi:hypothetical protein EW425_19545 [Salmonella enterica subsp. enterica serovar Stanley]|nr:hypothetical protein [Salmonella enterica subsp. enterica serovar Stanley]
MKSLIFTFFLTFCCCVHAERTIDLKLSSVSARFTAHAGAKPLCKGGCLDSSGFIDCPLNGSQAYETWNTHTGLITVTRLADGPLTVNSTKFQCTSEPLLVHGGIQFFKRYNESVEAGTIDISGMNVGDSRTGNVQGAGYIGLSSFGNAVRQPALDIIRLAIL